MIANGMKHAMMHHLQNFPVNVMAFCTQMRSNNMIDHDEQSFLRNGKRQCFDLIKNTPTLSLSRKVRLRVKECNDMGVRSAVGLLGVG